MKRIVIAIMLCLSAALTAQAGVKGVVLSAGGNNDQVYAGVGYQIDKGEVGARFGWTDTLDGTQECVELAAYALLDVIKDVNVPVEIPGLGSYILKATAYAGGKAGVLDNLKGPSDYDPSVSGIVGLKMVEGRIAVRLEYLLPVTDSTWENSATGGGKKFTLGFSYLW